MTLKSPPPDIVIGRLPIYLRALENLAKDGSEITSSYELGERLGISSAQIRKDLSHFGDFGKQGTGYNVGFLIEQLLHILKLDRDWDVVVIGAGHVGRALIYYAGFPENRFKPVAIFDADSSKIGQPVADLSIRDVRDVADFVRGNKIKIAMLATPAEAAQPITDELVAAGVQSILSYAPTTLIVPEGVQIQYIDPVSKLQHMAYYLSDDDAD